MELFWRRISAQTRPRLPAKYRTTILTRAGSRPSKNNLGVSRNPKLQQVSAALSGLDRLLKGPPKAGSSNLGSPGSVLLDEWGESCLRCSTGIGQLGVLAGQKV